MMSSDGHYFCCHCSQPIKLDDSFSNTGFDETLELVVDSNVDADKTQESLGNEEARHIESQKSSLSEDDTVPRQRHLRRRPPGFNVPVQDSFVMLSKSQVSPLLFAHTSDANAKADELQRGSISHRLKTTAKLFELMSKVADVDHPLCQGCADDLTLKLEKRLSDVRKEKETYETYLLTLKENQEAEFAAILTEDDLQHLRDEEAAAIEEYRQLEREKQALNDDLERIRLELQNLDTEKESYWKSLNDHQTSAREALLDHDSLKASLECATRQLDKLKKTNVYNDTFRIWHDGPFGTINGFRMGRLPNQPIDWNEINAAMGQALLLLDTIAVKLGFTFKRYRLVPLGNFSRIEKLEGDKSIYELYGSGDLKGMLFWNRRFDNALVVFLNCLQQIGDYAEQQDKNFRLPYRINKDKIGETSIRLQFNQEEAWTKALKCMLIDLKWVLAFCCARSTSQGVQ